MPFESRWRIVGTLTTIAPLHIGSGETTERARLYVQTEEEGPEGNGQKKKKFVEISAVATDWCRQPYIPGTSLKGNLRGWLKQCGMNAATIEAVFGSEKVEDEKAVGGKAEFWDAFVVAHPDPAPCVPHWCAQRLTGVAVSTAIDRRTRTVRPQKLFHWEFVPPGVQFEVTMTGQDLENEEVELLLGALEGFGDGPTSIALGAGTGDGWGRCTWALRDVCRLEAKEVAQWLRNTEVPVGYEGYTPLEPATRDALVSRARERLRPSRRSLLTLELTFDFDGPFLVNDPSQVPKKEQQDERKKDGQEKESLPNHMPLRDHKKQVVLPASSVRGALRSQAEKIVRTLRPGVDGVACRATDPADACLPITAATQREERLCLTCQVFGAPGWRAPIAFSDFTRAPESSETPFHQEFLAIDRFTGGGADHLKFNAEAVYQPMLTGTLTLDLARLDVWALGLVALTLRDVLEGDVTFGYGASKGYGACRATITGIRGMELHSTTPFGELLQNMGLQPEVLSIPDGTVWPTDEHEYMLIECAEAFQEKARTFVRRAQRTAG